MSSFGSWEESSKRFQGTYENADKIKYFQLLNAFMAGTNFTFMDVTFDGGYTDAKGIVTEMKELKQRISDILRGDGGDGGLRLEGDSAIYQDRLDSLHENIMQIRAFLQPTPGSAYPPLPMITAEGFLTNAIDFINEATSTTDDVDTLDVGGNTLNRVAQYLFMPPEELKTALENKRRAVVVRTGDAGDAEVKTAGDMFNDLKPIIKKIMNENPANAHTLIPSNVSVKAAMEAYTDIDDTINELVGNISAYATPSTDEKGKKVALDTITVFLGGDGLDEFIAHGKPAAAEAAREAEESAREAARKAEEAARRSALTSLLDEQKRRAQLASDALADMDAMQSTLGSTIGVTHISTEYTRNFNLLKDAVKSVFEEASGSNANYGSALGATKTAVDSILSHVRILGADVHTIETTKSFMNAVKSGKEINYMFGILSTGSTSDGMYFKDVLKVAEKLTNAEIDYQFLHFIRYAISVLVSDINTYKSKTSTTVFDTVESHLTELQTSFKSTTSYNDYITEWNTKEGDLVTSANDLLTSTSTTHSNLIKTDRTLTTFHENAFRILNFLDNLGNLLEAVDKHLSSSLTHSGPTPTPSSLTPTPSGPTPTPSSLTPTTNTIERLIEIPLGRPNDLPTVVYSIMQRHTFPSEYAFMKNKHEWSPMLFRPETRRLLYERLSMFVAWITDEIQSLINSTAKIVDGKSSPATPDDYRMLEQTVSYKFLVRIAQATSLQLSLSTHFGVQRPVFNSTYMSSFKPDPTSGKDVGKLIELIILKVFVVLAISSVLFTYVYVPEQMDATMRTFVLEKESQSMAAHHEVTFFQGESFMPLITFMSPDDAEKFEGMGGERFHWTNYIRGGDLTLEVHKFITPRLTGAFMHYFSYEGQTWAK